MKVPCLALTLLAFSLLVASSCKKDSQSPSPQRKIQFVLYTSDDLSNDNKLITFTLQIRPLNTFPPNLVLWDSTLAPMKIKDIPSLANKLVIEKIVPAGQTGSNNTLQVGFLYDIENVGSSWHQDTLTAGNTFKTVEFNFH